MHRGNPAKVLKVGEGKPAQKIVDLQRSKYRYLLDHNKNKVHQQNHIMLDAQGMQREGRVEGTFAYHSLSYYKMEIIPIFGGNWVVLKSIFYKKNIITGSDK